MTPNSAQECAGIEAVIARLKLRRIGRDYRGACPLHGGRDRTAFVVSPAKAAFHCFSCGESGTLRALGARVGLEVPDLRPEPVAAVTPRPVRPLGALDPAHPYLARRGIDDATARHFGCGFFAGRPPFGGRIVVPLHDPLGALVGHLGRALTDEEPRYLFQRGTPRASILFNLHRVRDASEVIVVEGVFDAMVLHAIGMPNVVSTLGCETTPTQHRLLRAFRQVTVLFDADEAGDSAAARLVAAVGPSARRVTLPKADPASLRPDVVLVALDAELKGGGFLARRSASVNPKARAASCAGARRDVACD